jgi:hypothetical protein
VSAGVNVVSWGPVGGIGTVAMALVELISAIMVQIKRVFTTRQVGSLFFERFPGIQEALNGGYIGENGHDGNRKCKNRHGLKDMERYARYV